MTADRQARSTIDWQAVYARLARINQSLQSPISPEEVGRILRDRAQALARPADEAPALGEALEILVFAVAGQRYGIETERVLEVVPLTELTPVPGTPPVVSGLVNHRGHILAVLDLRHLFDLPASGEGRLIVAIEAGRMTVGLLADDVEDLVRAGVASVAAAPVTSTGQPQASLRGVTEDGIAVLDPDALARDRRIIVNEEIG